ncbi:hypothetical protein GCM10027431_09230 [Lysobacter rhizosphaerae]
MDVAGDDVGATPLQDQAGQADAAAQFQDAFAIEFKTLHRLGQQQSGRPYLPEQAPLRAGNTHSFAMSVGIAELLQIAEYAQAPIMAAYGQCELAGGITWQWRSHWGVTLQEGDDA